MQVSNFPFLTDAEFTEACRLIEAQYEKARESRDEKVSWALRCRDKTEGNYLSITRSLKCELGQDDRRDHDEVNEVDEAVLHPEPRSADPHIEYDILLSPTYRVPVLYFSAKNVPTDAATDVRWMYSNVVPEHFQQPLRETGVMGGISMANHPISDIPAFFVHPCNTASAMEAAAEHKDLCPVEYLQLWLGIIGGSVGLHLPLAMAQDGARKPDQQADN